MPAGGGAARWTSLKSLPDILWIVTTQWRGQACGFAGDVNARTPNLDALARAGVAFAQAVTPHPFGPFARAALLTGVTSPANGVRIYDDPLPASSRTIAHELRERGYRTGFFGKWHLAPRDATAPLVGEVHAKTVVPAERRGGFDFWEGFEGGFLLNDPWLHGSRLPVPTRFSGYQSDVLCARAAEWWVEQPSPRFAVVSLEPPHPPYDAPAAGVRAVPSGEIALCANVPCGGEIEARARRELAGYYAHIAATDRAIGALVSRLDATGPGRAPHVIVTSVHGDMHGAHGLFRKGWPHEESVRIPLVVRAGSPAERPAHSDAPVSLLDARAWTLAWADRAAVSPSPPPYRLISMPSVVALPRQCDRPWRGVRTATRKLILDDTGEPWLFFDLAGDPYEQRNLANDPAAAAEIRELARLIP